MVLKCSYYCHFTFLSLWIGIEGVQSTWWFPFQPLLLLTKPMTISVCLCVCPRASVCVWLPVSLTRMQLLTQRRHNQKRQRHGVVTFTGTAPNGGVCSTATSPSTFSSTHSTRLPLCPVCLPPHRLYLLCCPSARLLVCLSVCQPASGLRRPASFIKRKQAGEITRDAGIWGQLICWQRHWGSQGSSTENKPDIYIV